MHERVKTGIPGLDDLICGGLPRGRTILVSGQCGTGKTTMAVQFLVNGILQYDENAILLTLEQNNQEICRDMATLGMDLEALQQSGRLVVIDTSLSKMGIKDYMASSDGDVGHRSLQPGEFNMDQVLALIVESAKKIDAKRVVIDSLPALDYLIKEGQDVRRALIHMNYELKAQNLTTIVLTEESEEGKVSAHGIEEYITDGVIILKINEALDTRTIKIRKMRVTSHSLKPITFELSPQGIAIKTHKNL